jgi:hypothetical protein
MLIHRLPLGVGQGVMHITDELFVVQMVVH